MAEVSWRFDFFVLEYGCIAFDRMAATHVLKLEKIQYRCFKIALGLMKSTNFQTPEIIRGVPLLKLRISMLNHKYLILDFDDYVRCYRS
jgi:hypothetical protein